MAQALILLGAFGLMVAAVYFAGRSGRARKARLVHCREKGYVVDLVLEHRLRGDWAAGDATDVVQCSAFDGPVTCDKHCLHDL